MAAFCQYTPFNSCQVFKTSTKKKRYHVLTFFSALFGQRRHVVVIAKIKIRRVMTVKYSHTSAGAQTSSAHAIVVSPVFNCCCCFCYCWHAQRRMKYIFEFVYPCEGESIRYACDICQHKYVSVNQFIFIFFISVAPPNQIFRAISFCIIICTYNQTAFLRILMLYEI